MNTGYDQHRPLDNAVRPRSVTLSTVRQLHLGKETLAPDLLAFVGILEIGKLIWLMKGLIRKAERRAISAHVSRAVLT